jgi:hypothetical protein
VCTREHRSSRHKRESDLYVRIAEKEGALYRIELSAPPGANVESVRPLLERFFDAALDQPDERRAFATPPPVQRRLC